MCWWQTDFCQRTAACNGQADPNGLRGAGAKNGKIKIWTRKYHYISGNWWKSWRQGWLFIPISIRGGYLFIIRRIIPAMNCARMAQSILIRTFAQSCPSTSFTSSRCPSGRRRTSALTVRLSLTESKRMTSESPDGIISASQWTKLLSRTRPQDFSVGMYNIWEWLSNKW